MKNIFNDKNYWLKSLDIKEKEVPDSLLVYGSWHAEKIFQILEKPISKIKITGLPKLRIGNYRNKKIFYSTVFGPAMSATICHLAGILGIKKIVLIGSCGALFKSNNRIILADNAVSTDGVTEWYFLRKKIFSANQSLIGQAENLCKKNEIEPDTGNVITVSHMLMEKKGDIERWNKNKFLGVDMETAPVYAIAEFFNMKSLSILVKAEQLKGEKIYPFNKKERDKTRDLVIKTALNLL